MRRAPVEGCRFYRKWSVHNGDVRYSGLTPADTSRLGADLFRSMLIAGLVGLLLAFLVWRVLPTGADTHMARALAGERWYRLTLDDRHLGYWHTVNGRDDAGHWTFSSEQRFALDEREPVTTRAVRIFAAQPPHPLLAAEHTRSRRGLVEGVRIDAAPSGYRVTRTPPDGTPEQIVDLEYVLADYLGFELWLDAAHPEPGEGLTVDTLDFERSALVGRSFDVISRSASGYVIENAAPHSATRIELDERYVPKHVRIAGLFDLVRTTRAEALAARSVLQAASYHVPADRRLFDPARISRLVLGVEGVDAPRTLFPDSRMRDGVWELRFESPLVVGGPVEQAHLAETIHLPTRHPDIVALAEGAVAGIASATARARALTDFVHGMLAYDPTVRSPGVLKLLADPRGDCTEFADLLTTLARSLGIPASTVFGLAYTEDPQPAFAYHAWNELYVDGGWLPVDPTWGQSRLDATHIPLPPDEAAALTLLTGTEPLTFKVIDVGHFQD